MPTIVHFDLPADDPERAKKFYEKLFDWKFNKVPMPIPYYLIETKDVEGNPGVRGGMGKRMLPEQQVSNYIGVPSVDEYLEKGKKARRQYHHAKNSSLRLGVSCDMC